MTSSVPVRDQQHLTDMQHVLEEGLQAIFAARNPQEAAAARARARARLEALGYRAARVDDRA